MVYTDIHFWMWLLLGVVFSILTHTNKVKTKIPSSTRDWIFLTFNFLFLMWNASFALRITILTAEGNKMSQADIDAMRHMANIFQILAIVGIGFLAGEIIFAIVQGIKNKQKDKKQDLDTANEPINKPKPIVSIDFKMNTADIAKMKADQLKAVSNYIDKLKDK